MSVGKIRVDEIAVTDSLKGYFGIGFKKNSDGSLENASCDFSKVENRLESAETLSSNSAQAARNSAGEATRAASQAVASAKSAETSALCASENVDAAVKLSAQINNVVRTITSDSAYQDHEAERQANEERRLFNEAERKAYYQSEEWKELCKGIPGVAGKDGKDGEPGPSGVWVGDTEPDPDKYQVWLNPLADEFSKVPENEVIEITVDALRILNASKKLIPGQRYRITDYEFHSTDPYFQNNETSDPFDIIVTVTGEYSISENALAVCKHDGDFLEATAWEIKYDLYGSPDRFAWMTSPDEYNKGVIYYMKDEFGNEAPYDFKHCLINGCLTFNNPNGSKCYNNKIGSCISDGKYCIPKVRFDCGSTGCYDNIIGNNCNIIKIFSGSHDNIIESGCTKITLKKDCHSNSIGSCCQNITLGGSSCYNTFMQRVQNISLKGTSIYNTFNSGCNEINCHNRIECCTFNLRVAAVEIRNEAKNFIIDTGCCYLVLTRDEDITLGLSNYHIYGNIQGSQDNRKVLLLDNNGSDFVEIRNNMRVFTEDDVIG